MDELRLGFSGGIVHVESINFPQGVGLRRRLVHISLAALFVEALEFVCVRIW